MKASFILLLLSVAGIIGYAQPGGAAAPARRVISLHGIDGVPLTASYKDAIAHFDSVDRSSKMHFGSGGCVARYSLIGLTLRYWQGDPLQHASVSTCIHFGQAVVTAPGWRTPAGLELGANTQALLEHYPHAFDTRMTSLASLPHAIQWDLTFTHDGPALFALVSSSHVVALIVEVVGH